MFSMFIICLVSCVCLWIPHLYAPPPGPVEGIGPTIDVKPVLYGVSTLKLYFNVQYINNKYWFMNTFNCKFNSSRYNKNPMSLLPVIS